MLYLIKSLGKEYCKFKILEFGYAYFNVFINQQEIITTDDICSRISKNSLIRERRILKEGLRFFINIMIYKRQEKEIVNRLCWLINEGLRNKDDPECLKLSLFALMIVSEQPKFHKKLITHSTLLQNLSIQSQENLN